MTARLESLGNGRYALHGVLSFESVVGLWRQAPAQFEQVPLVSIDLAGVEQSNSAGVALLVSWSQQATLAQQTLALRNVPIQMQAIIQVAALENILG